MRASVPLLAACFSVLPSLGFAAVIESNRITVPGAGTEQEVGVSLAQSADYLVAGARGGTNTVAPARAYVLDAATGAVRHTFTGGTNTQYGLDVAADGNTIAVSEISADAGAIRSGIVHVYDADTGATRFTYNGSNQGNDDRLGAGLAINGNRIAAGAPEVFNQGNGFVDLINATTGALERRITAADGSNDDQFGANVALSDDYLVVGAARDDDNGSNSGSVYVYDPVTGAQLFKLGASDASSADFFGSQVALQGDLLAVTATGAGGTGAAYTFDLTTGNQIHRMVAADAAANDNFGNSLDLFGDFMLVGSRFNDAEGNDAGAAYLFDITTGLEVEKYIASDAAATDRLGQAAVFGASGEVFASALELGDGRVGSIYEFEGSSHSVPAPTALGVLMGGASLVLVRRRRGRR